MKLAKSTISHLKNKKSSIASVVLVLLIAKLLGFGVPLALKNLVDGVSNLHKTPEIYLLTPVLLVLTYGLCGMLSLVFNELKEFLSAKLTHQVIASLGVKIFREIHALPIQYLLKKQSGVITREIDRGIKGLQLIISVSIHSLIPSIFEFLIVATYFAWSYDWIFFVTLTATLFAYIVFTALITSLLVKKKNELNKADSSISHKLVDCLQNAENVKLFGNEEFEIKKFTELNETHLSTVIKIQKIFTLLSVGQQAIVSVGGVLILWLCISRIFQGLMGVGDLVMISALVMQVFLPINALGVLYKDSKQALVDIQNLNSIIENESSQTDNLPNINLISDSSPSIEFINVDFSYGSVNALRDVSFRIEGGQSVAIVGSSGSGKSTLIKLLCRLYEPTIGKIFIQGQDLRNFNARSTRNLIGVVPQEISLFNGTLFYNIGYGDVTASHNDVIHAASIAQLDDLIKKLPEGYETIVGERGQMLSGGERQRVGIARALLKNPPILIFDEATSSLDLRTESLIQMNVIKALRNKTVLIIAHRLSTIAHVDKILVLHQGRLAGAGSHNELIQTNSVYQELWANQHTQK